MPEKLGLIPALMVGTGNSMSGHPIKLRKEYRMVFGIGYFHIHSTGIEYPLLYSFSFKTRYIIWIYRSIIVEMRYEEKKGRLVT
jgi:hypothetical protein